MVSRFALIDLGCCGPQRAGQDRQRAEVERSSARYGVRLAHFLSIRPLSIIGSAMDENVNVA